MGTIHKLGHSDGGEVQDGTVCRKIALIQY